MTFGFQKHKTNSINRWLVEHPTLYPASEGLGNLQK